MFKLSKKAIIIIVTILVIIGGLLFRLSALSRTEDNPAASAETAIPVQPRENKKIIEIQSGNTYGQLMSNAGIDSATTSAIFEAAAPVYGLEKIRVGYSLELVYNTAGDEFQKLIYKIDSENELTVVKDELGQWRAEVKPIAYETRIVTKGGELKTSMYAAALENDIDERAIIALADAFQWTIDFALDPRVGDTFKFIYEERYLDGRYIMPGKILAGVYTNAGQPYYVYYFSEDENNTGYFDENGNSVQKMFLKAPVNFKYISSSFTTGRRYVEAFNVSTGHRAVDYAAAYGTPIRAVGDGTITMAASNGAYGIMVKIRHNGTYSTNYGHMSKLAVRAGNKVKQGDTIGYVGSTGFSTGPHVHFEMIKNGVKINPLTEVTPPGQAIKDENKERFVSAIKDWQEQLQ